jgi:ribonucleoside-diphosphate reductase alpha chain
VLGIDVRGLYGSAFEDAYQKIEAAFEAGKLRVAKKYDNARDLMKKAMVPMFETGMPYVAFIDTINEANPNRDDPETYGILNVNLCVESYSNTKPDVYAHVCNLCSINLSNIKDMDELARVSRQACRMLEYGIELTNDPTAITKAHNQRFRTIGIGIMGLHDYLVKNKLTYKDLDVISEIAECIEYNAVLESIELAKQYGSFLAFEHSQWKTGEMTARFKKDGCGKYDWDYAQTLIDRHGMRHSQLTSPAPTTSTSVYQDCSSSFLPVFDTFFVEENSNGKQITAAKFLAKYPLGYTKTLPKFKAKEIIDVASRLQKHIDTGISMELMFDHNDPEFTAKTVWDTIHYAHQKKCKAIYYIRHIKKNELAVKEEAACESCAS